MIIKNAFNSYTPPWAMHISKPHLNDYYYSLEDFTFWFGVLGEERSSNNVILKSLDLKLLVT